MYCRLILNLYVGGHNRKYELVSSRRLEEKDALRRVENIVRFDLPLSNTWSGFQIFSLKARRRRVATTKDGKVGATLPAKHAEIDATGGQRGTYKYQAGASADV